MNELGVLPPSQADPLLTSIPACAATSRIFANKLGVLPDRVLPALLHDRTIAKGTPLEFITEFFQDYLSTEPIDDLVVLLRKARLDERLLDFFPPQKRSLPELDAHFQVGSGAPRHAQTYPQSP